MQDIFFDEWEIEVYTGHSLFVINQSAAWQ